MAGRGMQRRCGGDAACLRWCRRRVAWRVRVLGEECGEEAAVAVAEDEGVADMV